MRKSDVTLEMFGALGDGATAVLRFHPATAHLGKLPDMQRIIVAVDPALTGGCARSD